MPYSRPTLTALQQQAIEDITTSGVPGLTGLLRNAVLRVLAWVMAGLAYGVYGYGDWIARMAVPFTALGEYLYAWAGLVGVYTKDAAAASGSAQFNGTTGRTIPNGTALTRFDGVPYATTADGTTDVDGLVTVPIVATVTGANTDCDPGTPININIAIDGINLGGFTVGETSGGADEETDEALRTRMLQRYREPPQGGAQTDYIGWALEVPGVTRAWCDPNGAGAGTVVVYTMFDDVRAAEGGFPQGSNGTATAETRLPPIATGDQLVVADYIYPLRPVTALVVSAAPVAFPVDVTIQDLDPNTVDMQAAITATLQDAFIAVGAVAGTVYPSDLYEAILTVSGINHFAMIAPALPVTAPTGGLPTLGVLSMAGAS
jgi:uncharacterized phage protein gp47/JayE